MTKILEFVPFTGDGGFTATFDDNEILVAISDPECEGLIIGDRRTCLDWFITGFRTGYGIIDKSDGEERRKQKKSKVRQVSSTSAPEASGAS